MRRALLTLAVLVALAMPAAAQSPAVARHVLPNGLVVLVREDPNVGVVAASLLVRTGSAFETTETAGVTNFLWCDGTVRPISDSIDAVTWQAVCTPQGGEAVTAP